MDPIVDPSLTSSRPSAMDNHSGRPLASRNPMKDPMLPSHRLDVESTPMASTFPASGALSSTPPSTKTSSTNPVFPNLPVRSSDIRGMVADDHKIQARLRGR